MFDILNTNTPESDFPIPEFSQFYSNEIDDSPIPEYEPHIIRYGIV